MADPGLITAAGAVALTVAQTISGVLNLGTLKRRVARLAKAVEQELPADIAALAKRIDAIRSADRRQTTASQPSTNIIGEIQGLRDRATAAEGKVVELTRRLDEQREAFAAHCKASDEAWHDLNLQIREIVVAVRGTEALGMGGGRGRR